MNKQIKRFFYDSNACWGYVETFDDLVEKVKLQLSSGSAIKNVEDCLEKSKSCKHDTFGTRVEHQLDYNLKNYLQDNGVLESFLTYYQSYQ